MTSEISILISTFDAEHMPKDSQRIMVLSNQREWRLVYWNDDLDLPLLKAGYYVCWFLAPDPAKLAL